MLSFEKMINSQCNLINTMQGQLNWYSRFHLGKHNYHIVSLLQFLQLPSVRSILNDKVYYDLLNSTDQTINQQSLMQLKASIIKQIQQKFSSSSIPFREYQILQLDQQEFAQKPNFSKRQKRNKNKSQQGDVKQPFSNDQQSEMHSMVEQYQRQIIGDALSDNYTQQLYQKQDTSLLSSQSKQEVRIVFDKKTLKDILVQKRNQKSKDTILIQKRVFQKSQKGQKDSIIDKLKQYIFQQPALQDQNSGQKSQIENLQRNRFLKSNQNEVIIFQNERIRNLSNGNVQQSVDQMIGNQYQLDQNIKKQQNAHTKQEYQSQNLDNQNGKFQNEQFEQQLLLQNEQGKIGKLEQVSLEEQENSEAKQKQQKYQIDQIQQNKTEKIVKIQHNNLQPGFNQHQRSRKSSRNEKSQDCSSDDIYNLNLFIHSSNQKEYNDPINQAIQEYVSKENYGNNNQNLDGQAYKQYQLNQSQQVNENEATLKNIRSQTTNIAINQTIQNEETQQKYYPQQNIQLSQSQLQQQFQDSFYNQESNGIIGYQTPSESIYYNIQTSLGNISVPNLQPPDTLLSENDSALANVIEPKKKASFKQKLVFKRFEHQKIGKVQENPKSTKKNFKLAIKQQPKNPVLTVKRTVSLPPGHKFPNKKLSLDKNTLYKMLANTKVIHKDILIKFFKQN